MPNLLNNCLRRVRENALPKVPLGQIAEKVGVSKAYISKFEIGTLKKPSREVLDKLMDIYDCSPATRSVLEQLMKCDGGPLDGMNELDGSVPPIHLWPLPVSASLMERFRGEAGDPLNVMPPLRLGMNLVTSFITEPGSESLRWLLNGPLPTEVLENSSEQMGHKNTFAITPQAIVRSLFEEQHWLVTQEYQYQRFLAVLLDEPERVFLTDKPILVDADLVVVDGPKMGIMAFIAPRTGLGGMRDRGAIASSGHSFWSINASCSIAHKNPMPPEKAVEFVHKLRKQMVEVRETLATLGDCKIVRGGGVVEVVEKKKG